jgi:hypothetical protein
MGAGRVGRRAGAVGLAAVLLVGCGSQEPEGSVTSSPTPSGSAPAASPSPSPALTDAAGRELTEAEAQAFREATDVVVAYRQVVIDLLSGARTELNDLNSVVQGDLLDDDLRNMQRSIVDGRRVQPAAEVVLVSSTPVSVDLGSEPAKVRVRACIDLTGITFTQPDGSQNQGTRGQVDYTVTKTDYLPAPGWAVVSIKGPADEGDRSC